MKALIYALVICGSVIAAGCGQKGGLYLPDQNAAVITRPAGSSTAAPQTPQNEAPQPPPPTTTQGTPPESQQDKDKNKDKPQSNSTPPRS